MDEREAALRRAAEIGIEFLAGLPERRVGASDDASSVAERLDTDLPDEGMDARRVVEELAEAVDRGLVASLGPRYFGFVIGGQLPASAAADWLTTVWGQNAVVHAASPAGDAACTTAFWPQTVVSQSAAAEAGSWPPMTKPK